MKNLIPLMKRVAAYLIDLFFILALSSLITSTSIFDKQSSSYKKTYDEYQVDYQEYANYFTNLNKYYEDETINEEEYQELIKNENYQELITSLYEDKKISKGEYQKIIDKFNEDFSNISNDYLYKLNKKGIYSSITTLIITILYFGVLQYFLKGVTLGKKLLKLQVVSNSNKELTIFNYLFRSLIVNQVLINIINLIFLSLSTKTVYIKANTILETVISVIEAIITFLVLTREDNRGLHDLLFNTKVVSTSKENLSPSTEVVEIEEVIEEEKPKQEKTKKVIEEKATKTTKTNKEKNQATKKKSTDRKELTKKEK